MEDVTSKEILKKALKFLARREYSAFELKTKLKQLGFEAKDIVSVLGELKQKNWQSDSRFAENYFSFRSKRGFGPLKISAELEARRVDLEIITQVVNQDQDFWFDLIKSQKNKKYGSKKPRDFREKARQMRFLQSRGFTLEQILKIF
jgi:regulatory protein